MFFGTHLNSALLDFQKHTFLAFAPWLFFGWLMEDF